MISLKVRAIYGPNENPCRAGSLRLEENPHFSLSAAGGTPAPSLSTVPNLKWWVICYGPKGSRKAWPNLTKPEGHKKDFEQNVSGLLALPIPSQLLRANNFHVMAVGERRGEKSEKSFWQKTASFGRKKANELHSVCTSTVCAWLPRAQRWPCPEQQQPGTAGSVLGLLHVWCPSLAPCLGGAALHSTSPPEYLPAALAKLPYVRTENFPSEHHGSASSAPAWRAMQKIPRSPSTGVMSIGWSRSVFPVKIWAARLLPFLKIQVELCFPLWAVLGEWEKGSQ